jgi:outer membrane protein assembly factor BamE (lipoprotein component of BamABCDE complex)
MKFKVNILFVIIGCLVLGGCGRAVIYGTQIPSSYTDEIRKGWTTKQQVIDLLGKPAEVLRPTTDQEILVYESMEERPRSSVWSAIFFNIGHKPGMKKETTRLTVTLDSSGVVKDYKVDELYTEYLPLSQPASPSPAGSTSSYQYRPPQYPSSTGYRR